MLSRKHLFWAVLLISIFDDYATLMLRNLPKTSFIILKRSLHMAAPAKQAASTQLHGMKLEEIPKSNHFTSSLPPDSAFPTPIDSHNAPREKLGPRMVREALYTYVRPEKKEAPELLAVSSRALRDLGLQEGEAKTDQFRDVFSGNKILTWDEEKSEGIYPWAQCYGGARPDARVHSVY